ncbi:uncharacterized protein LOC128886751 [Hylaeus anthracinus]|uniref:uncharacterized protein LOC128886751 n=1 Tax=Hylaeus anthracinus TaxID=313031 RepID=UPI0023B9DEE4|nr:uncharacterized protein LOC128886751 [Hylaeus anthracinus]XP_053997886.1 uncharacterized protein LOC128886751 [Hylaeus anthracinus]
MKPPLPRWKLYRWLKWAIEEGIIDPVEYFVPIRSLKVVSPLKTFEKSVIDRFNDADMEEHLQKEEIDRGTTSEKSDRKRKHRDKSKESSGKTSKKSSKKTPKDSQKKTSEDLPVDISFWVDFNKMEPYVRDVHFFYKLDLFQYTAKVSDRLTSRLQDHRSETKKGSRTGSKRSSPSKEPDFVDVHCWPQKMSPTRNEPLYIFTDSLEEKFFLIDFSTFQVRVDPRASTVPMSGEGDRKTSSSSIPVVDEDYLIVEKHNWFRRPKKTYSLVYIQTAGTRSTVMELKPGRHLLRVYCRSESNCFLTISSDTSFQLGDRKRMYQLMSIESETIDQAVRHISNSLSRAYQSFGTETYQEALMAYYDSYMPPPENIRNRSKAFYDNIHECFIDEQVQLIRKILPADQLPGVLWSLRVFFLNPIIGMQCFNPMLMMLKNMRESTTTKYSTNSSQERFNHGNPVDHYAATIIQSFFKMLMIRKYRRIHDPSHAQHQLVLENLAKVAELFDYNKRESLAAQMLRNILRQFDRLQDVYPCTRDFEYTLQVQELTGTLGNVKSNQWLPMARFTVNPRITETVFAGVDLFVDVPRYSVRVFDNETEHEMLRVVNNVVPTRYHHTSLGYTIFGYGWSEEKVFEELTWTMTIITMKGQPVFYSANDETSPSAITLPLLVTEELSNVYIPNASKYISKWIVKVASPTLASFRLRTSYDKVKIKFRVTDEKGRVLTQVKGTSVVILPVAYLGLQREESQMQVNVENNVEGSHLGRIGTNHDKLSNGDESYSIGDTVEEKLESKVSQESMSRRTYYAEAFVLEDSWPLTKSEWAAVMEIKSKVTGSIAKTKSSVSITNKVSKSDGSRTRKGSKQSVDGGQAVETPRWVLQVVTDSGSGLEITQDRTKEKEIAQMKEAWAKENPDSLQRGRELREAFIAKHEIPPEASTVEGIKKSSTQTVKFSTKRASRGTVVDCCLETSATKIEKRTTKPCQSLRRLPAVDLSSYKIKEDEEEVSWLKTSHDEEVLSNIRALNIIYAEEDYNHVLEEMNGLLKSRRKGYRELFGKHKDSFWEKRALLEDVYEARKAYIGTTKSVSVQSTKRSARSKKSTKSKKV